MSGFAFFILMLGGGGLFGGMVLRIVIRNYWVATTTYIVGLLALVVSDVVVPNPGEDRGYWTIIFVVAGIAWTVGFALGWATRLLERSG